MPELWSALIGIDRHWSLIEGALKKVIQVTVLKLAHWFQIKVAEMVQKFNPAGDNRDLDGDFKNIKTIIDY